MAFTALLLLAVLLQCITLGGGYLVFVHLRYTIAALLYRATTDKLTGVPNRDEAEKQLKVQLANGTALGVAFVDVDDFKAINDTYSHHAGDAALRYVAARLNEAADPYMVARYSGDEFLIILDAGGLYVAEVIAHAVLRRIEETPFIYFGRTIPIKVSIGVAVADDTSDPDELLRRADHAMYQAKRNDHMNPVTWMPGMTMPEPTPETRRTFRDAPTR
ncbi:hypothetical protein GCM10020358_49150 [Amorphoplanes nipponensis]|uniref:GGDEF domain-containing protein n=1 Tax=Actinoplanes nipponensis TaxID=135950 RepID=A0A919JPW2_9ACTN|nr:GGDEF domain-containing protein [Actinoplanes nipponensis]GIE53160.1 hypothetical protein Ani05nite_66940 [Actinoplanes nipponensis]